jgi:two-component system, cell cycle response regulator DivK
MARVLYVEDNDDNIFMLKRRLERAGHVVIVARDGLQGLDMAHEEVPDLILMDLSVPGLDGWAASERLKSAPETRAIPIIALSSHAMAGDREKALAAGCDDYDTKPIDFQRLLSKMEAQLKRRPSL